MYIAIEAHLASVRVRLMMVTQKFHEFRISSIPHPTTIITHLPFLNQTRSVYSVFLSQHQKNTNKKKHSQQSMSCTTKPKKYRAVSSLFFLLLSLRRRKKALHIHKTIISILPRQLLNNTLQLDCNLTL